MTAYLQQRSLFPPFIQRRPSPLLGMVVVIPCCDEDFLLLSLMCLKKCDRPTCDVEVIVVINESENAPECVRQKNQNTWEQATRWIEKNQASHLCFHLIYKDNLPRKHAGVGLARKIGMDEAVHRLEKVRRPGGIIACFDADSRCEKNYFTALENHFRQHPKAQACGICFEHPLEGAEFGEDVYRAITLYELHLRYYVLAQRWAGFPFAFQTIGSSMAVRCDAYQQQGGMNRRQAGEDFYFLQKYIPLGGFAEISTTKIHPSPRPSHRVPFGTGKAVGELLRSGSVCQTYHPSCFCDLKAFFKAVPNLFNLEKSGLAAWLESLPESIRQFLSENDFEEKLAEIQSNTTSRPAFQKRFFRWFDAFLLMKYVHFAREQFHPEIEVTQAARWLLANANGWQVETVEKASAKDLLLTMRQLERQV